MECSFPGWIERRPPLAGLPAKLFFWASALQELLYTIAFFETNYNNLPQSGQRACMKERPDRKKDLTGFENLSGLHAATIRHRTKAGAGCPAIRWDQLVR